VALKQFDIEYVLKFIIQCHLKYC